MKQIKIDDFLKKDYYLRIRLRNKDHVMFQTWCELNDITMSKAIRDFIDETIATSYHEIMAELHDKNKI